MKKSAQKSDGADQMNKLPKNDILYILFFFISIFITIINIGGKYEIDFLNIQWPFNSSFVFYNLFNGFTFYNYGNISFINFFNFPETLFIYILSLIGFPVYMQEIFIISVFQFIALYYFYKLFYAYIFNFIDDNAIKTFVSALASLLVVFSFASQTVFWWNFIPGGFFLLSFGSAMLYYILLFYENYFDGRFVKKYLLYILIFSSLSISVNTPFNISFLWLFLITPIFPFINNFNKTNFKRLLFGYLIIILIMLIGNIWYIYPTLLEGYYIPFNTKSGTNFNLSIFYLAGNINILKIMEFTYATSQYSYPSLGSSIFFKYGKILAYAIFPIIFGGIISLNSKSNRNYFYLLFIYFITFLLLIGSEGPFKYLYLDLLFRNSELLLAFRNPYTALIFSFNLLYILLILFSGYRIFFSIHIYYKEVNIIKLRRYKKTIVRVIAILIILIMILPIISTSANIYLGEAIPVSPLKSRVQIPEYEVQTANYISEKLNNYNYVYLFPGGGVIDENWTHGYDGFDLLPNLIGSNYVIDSPANSMEDYLCEYIKYGETWEVPNFASSLSDLGIKYLVIEGNITATPYWSYTYTPNYQSILYSLNHTSNISLIKQFGSNYIYENTLNAKLVYIPEEAVNSSVAVNGIFPTKNITKEYYDDINRSYAMSPNNFINASYNGSILISVNE
ncbi:hypothetical protein ACNF40_08560, partial [Cuniculiplasma sp. SKW4]